MAILYTEAREAGFSAAAVATNLRPTFEDAFAAFVAAAPSPPLPVDEIQKAFYDGWSSAIGFYMDAY